MLVLSLGLSACSQTSLKLPDPARRQTGDRDVQRVLYRPQQEFEKISCDVSEGCYVVSSEMEAGLLIGNLVRSGQRKAAMIADEDLDLDKNSLCPRACTFHL
ncbi:MAG: hypothetical protein ACLSA6_06095 [Holdemania massiliensis]